ARAAVRLEDLLIPPAYTQTFKLLPYTTLVRSPGPDRPVRLTGPHQIRERRMHPQDRPDRRGRRQPPNGQLLQHQVRQVRVVAERSEEHTSELQSRENIVCRLLLEKKKNMKNY